jgi:hypothetical protein
LPHQLKPFWQNHPWPPDAKRTLHETRAIQQTE